MLLRTPTKLTLTLVYLFLLTACGGAVGQPTAPPAATAPTSPPATPTPEPAPQLDFAAGMTAVQQQ